MDVDRIALATAREAVVAGDADCLWIRIADRRSVPHPLVEWVDWRLQGQIGRTLELGPVPGNGITYLPTLGRIALRYVVLDESSALSADAIAATCGALALRHVLLVPEPGSAERHAAALARASAVGLPARVSVSLGEMAPGVAG